MATMQAAISGVQNVRAPFQIKSYAAACLCLIAVLSLVFWFQPFWVIDQATQLRLSAAGMHGGDVLIDGHKIHFIAGGSGTPVVLVHGLGSRASDWVGLIPALVHSGHRVYALDLLGYGRSDRPADAHYSIEEEAHIVEGFLKAENLNQVDLAGWSMGGWISMVVARDMPQNISRLVLLDSAGVRFQPNFDPLLFTPTDLDQLHQLEHLLMADGPTMPNFLAKAFLVRAQPDAWVIRRSVDSMLTGQDLMDDSLGALKMPVLIVWGRQDMLTPLSLAYAIQAGIPNAKLNVIDGCGHLAPGLCAGKIAPGLLQFLKQAPAQQQTATLASPR